MSLQTILNKKNSHIDKLLLEFEKEFIQSSVVLKNNLAALFKSGDFAKADIIKVFEQSGLAQSSAAFVDKYDDLFKFSSEIAAEIGSGFALSTKSFDVFEKMSVHNLEKILETRLPIINTIYDAALKFEVDQLSFKEVVKLLDKKVGELGRRISTEAFTGITDYGRAVNLEHFTQAEIERFIYFGPQDAKNRDECAQVLADPANSGKGFTMEEIAGLPVDFVGGGGFNCRHEFLPAV